MSLDNFIDQDDVIEIYGKQTKFLFLDINDSLDKQQCNSIKQH